MPNVRGKVAFNIVFLLVVFLIATNIFASRTTIRVHSISQKDRDDVVEDDDFKDGEGGRRAPKNVSSIPQMDDRDVADADAEGDDQDDDKVARHALRHIPSNKRWHREDTEVLSSISLPLWEDAARVAEEAGDAPPSDVDRLDGVHWLPPRLPLPDRLRARPYGVLFVGTGSDKYARGAMLPMIRYLRDALGIPDAEERARTSEGGGRVWQGFALVTGGKFVGEDGPLRDDASAFFDAVYVAEDDLPSYPLDWEAWRRPDDKGDASLRKVAAIKAAKVRAMASSPFDATIVLDFDSFPCRADFGTPLLEMFDGADVGLTNVVRAMEDLTDARHYLGEHSSAIVVLNMTSVRTRMMLGLYVQSFLRQAEMREGARRAGKVFRGRAGKVFRGRERKQRDQPALKVAMLAMSGGLAPMNDGEKERGMPKNPMRGIIERLGLGFLRHVDFSSSVLCRRGSSSHVTCGRESTCIVAHKAKIVRSENGTMEEEEDDEENDEEEQQNNVEESEVAEKEDTPREEKASPTKFFGLGFKKTGTTSLDRIFDRVMDRLGGSRPPDRERVRAMNRLMGRDDARPSLALAERHHYFQDAPWCNEPQRLYRRLARLHPTSKYVLTVRDPDEWYDSVERHVRCPPRNGGRRCGRRKMERYRAAFGAGGTSREDFARALESHNDAVREFFVEVLRRPDRLLEIDLTDEAHRGGAGWAIICDFVGLSEADCPTDDFPHENISAKQR